MEKYLRLVLFGSAQGSLGRALLAPRQRVQRSAAPEPDAAAAPEPALFEWNHDPRLQEAAVSALLAGIFAPPGH